MIVQADAVLLPLVDQAVDLVFGSPPYCDARDYGIGAGRKCLGWVKWMLAVTAEAQRACRGPVLWVAAGVTRDRCYWPACEGLMWEWWKRGGDCQLYRPCIWVRNCGIPGSGGNDWFRADAEYVMCFKRPGKLPWSDNTAMGHPPKYAPGGEMSHRLSDGSRRDQWGGTESSNAGSRRKNGKRGKAWRPSHRQHTKRRVDGKMEIQNYAPPVLVNPGNVVKTNVGGGHMGDRLAHKNEAPFPEKLVEHFVCSLCPPGGIVLDPFCGSGTTAIIAQRYRRRFVACDLRMSQCGLSRRRLNGNQLALL